MSSFVHLHVHSHYSILDGMSKISALVNKCIENGMLAMALTDHGNMFGVKEFFDTAKKKNEEYEKNISKLRKILKSEKATDEEKENAKNEIAELETHLFKPIIGCEAYCARRSLYDHDPKAKYINENGVEKSIDKSGYHLILLAKNNVGYHNLCKLISIAWVDGFYSKPRIDKNILEQYHEGLIVCSACLGGELPQLILSNKIDEAKEAARWFKNIFGDDFYIEIQRHKTDKPNSNQETYLRQKEVNKVLIDIANELDIKVVATNDVHFVEEEHGEAHQYLIALNTGRKINELGGMRYTKQEWLKTPTEMEEIFSDIPEALETSLEIANKIERFSIDHAPIMPVFDIPADFGSEEEYRQRITEQELFDEFTRDEKGNVVLSEKDANDKISKLGGYEKLYRVKFEADYLQKLTLEGATMRYGSPLPDDVMERILFELHTIKCMGFPGYFLIVSDFIDAARKMGVSVGPGRGSAAGSAVAYCLKITDIDPLKYDLLFERFLNPDRISLPDIDIDFEDEGRAKVLQWVTNKYGAERVAHIITFGTMAAKSSVKDVSRIEEIPLSTVNQICSLIPAKFDDSKRNKDGKPYPVTLKNCAQFVPEISAQISNNVQLSRMWEYASELEGTVRQTGVHACGVIIGADDLMKFAPIATGKDSKTNETVLVTQYQGSLVESVGLIKMDFLGLSTLSIINEALRNIKISKGIDIDINKIPIDDKATYDLFCQGRTIGTFQFESLGMQKYLKQLKPSRFEDLIAMNALYRPGPMSYIPSYIERKHDPSKITYDIPCMEKYLKETYGITVYQEQVMLLSRELADFTRGESDQLRKAMGKKKKDLVDAMKPKFIQGGVKNGHNPEVLESIWTAWEKFAEYAFNKSHATCYSWVAYQTAYLKAHYPAEFMAANLTSVKDQITKVAVFLEECHAMHLKVLRPDVNESLYDFSVNKYNEIRFGLGAIKGLGAAVVNAIIVEREKNGAFTSVFDFVERVPKQSINRRSLESLVLSGALDSFTDLKREDYFAETKQGTTFLEELILYASKYQSQKKENTHTLFDDFESMEGVKIPYPKIIKVESWPDIERLNKEKDAIGLYLSAHPLDRFGVAFKHLFSKLSDVNRWLADHTECKFRTGGLITNVRKQVDSTGNNYAFVTIQDYESTIELAFWSQDYKKFANLLEVNSIIVVNGSITSYLPKAKTAGTPVERKYKVKIDNVIEANEKELNSIVKNISVNIPVTACDEMFRQEFNDLILQASNNDKPKVPLRIIFYHPTENKRLETLCPIPICVDNDLLNSLTMLNDRIATATPTNIKMDDVIDDLDDYEEFTVLPDDEITDDDSESSGNALLTFKLNS